jgi:adenosylmethionine-8-amino-7-oxononanoate aminotransferase
VAMKMAAQFWFNKGSPERSKFIAFRDAYHGDTMGAMSVCDPQDGMHAALNAYLPRQIFAALPRTDAEIEAFDALLKAQAERVAAVIVEPLVQGAGGMRFHRPRVLPTKSSPDSAGPGPCSPASRLASLPISFASPRR